MLFDRPQSGRRAVLVHVEVSQRQDGEELQEFRELAVSGQFDPVAIVSATPREPNPKFLIGTGKLEEIRAAVAAHDAGIVLFNHTLSPAQERNIERELKCAVMDRTGVILDIFAQRARSHEGRLQVELARLEHLSTRLVRGWTHLERQRGGIGVRGGPGETQIELDRRMIRERIKQLTKKLGKVGKRRDLNRATRRKVPIPTVSLVGYTNAGKSTLFNQLTRANVYAADQLFATLDPTLRRLDLPHSKSVILADTVGFIRHLPHSLVTAFHATLEETIQANLLLHVVDAHSDQRHSNIDEVNSVLREIGADDVHQIEVFNKIDLVAGEQARIERDSDGVVTRVWVSAATGAGMDLLMSAVADYFQTSIETLELRIPVVQARLRAALHALGVVASESLVGDAEWRVVVEVDQDQRSAIVQHPDFHSDMLATLNTELDESKRLAGVA